MTKKLVLFIFLFIIIFNLNAQSNRTISGYVREKGSKELLIGVNVYIKGQNIGTSTNTYGFYSVSAPASDTITMVYSYVGYIKNTVKVNFKKNIEQNIELSNENMLDEVIVKSKYEENKVSETVQMSKIEIPIGQIKKIPTLLGEKDVLKVLQLMPGVQKGSEGQSGVYVRGGGPDQNLIILDDATVYNASHLFGFFSTFNGDALKSVELTKGGFPARYGGRLSSVIEMNMKDGNKTKFSGEGGIGLISSRMVLEGPIRFNKNKPARASFVISGRRTYLDQIAKPFIAARNKNSTTKDNAGYYFYDFNAKFNYEISNKDKLYLSGYFGEDKFGVNSTSETINSKNGIDWGNLTTTLRWNHQFSQKLFSNTSLIFSKYQFDIFGNEEVKETANNPATNFNLKYSSGIEDKMLKYDLDYFPNQHHAIKAGLQVTYHIFTPGATVIQNSSLNIDLNNPAKLKSTESGIYVEDTYQPISALKINGGFRMSSFTTNSKNYIRPEPRLAIAYKFTPSLAVKGSYARMNQYLHLLSSTGLGLPTDLWVPTTDKVAPQQSQQVALGLAKDLNEKQGISITLEAYYKKMNNIINYKEGASFLQLGGNTDLTKPNTFEDKVTAGNGVSYGLELLVQKKLGRLSGWVGYTLSKTEWQFDELNFGKKFFPKYDRRNDASVVVIYELRPKITLSGTWVYGTGNAITIPYSQYTAFSSSVNRSFAGASSTLAKEYGEKNSFRAEPYHRLDFGLQYHRKKRRYESTWDLSVYNLYSRKNPFFYTVGKDGKTSFFGGFEDQFNQTQTQGTTYSNIVLKRFSLFPIIPSLTYSFKF